jgi:hypothetical protein
MMLSKGGNKMNKETAKHFANKEVFYLRAELHLNGLDLKDLAPRLDGISYDALKRIMRDDGKQEPKAWQLLEIEHQVAELCEEKKKAESQKGE